jgi:hypothetical protein
MDHGCYVSTNISTEISVSVSNGRAEIECKPNTGGGGKKLLPRHGARKREKKSGAKVALPLATSSGIGLGFTRAPWEIGMVVNEPEEDE